MKTLFLVWRNPKDNRCLPVGRLSRVAGGFEFVYTKGAIAPDFQPFMPFPDLNTIYVADELFPLFLNRVPPSSRPDYSQYLEWLNFPSDPNDPIALLARSGGRRATDAFEVFPCPEKDKDGLYHIHFFVHGIRHLPEPSINRILALRERERLLLAYDFQNPHDPHAIMLRTHESNESFEADRFLVGYCPRYLLGDALELISNCGPETVVVTVERLNLPPAPLQLRLLCNLTACWPEEFQPFTDEMYQPISNSISAKCQ